VGSFQHLYLLRYLQRPNNFGGCAKALQIQEVREASGSFGPSLRQQMLETIKPSQKRKAIIAVF